MNSIHTPIPFDQVLSQIMSAEDHEITLILRAVMERYQRLFSDSEIIFLSIPKDDPAERRQILEHAVHLLDEK